VRPDSRIDYDQPPPFPCDQTLHRANAYKSPAAVAVGLTGEFSSGPEYCYQRGRKAGRSPLAKTVAALFGLWERPHSRYPPSTYQKAPAGVSGASVLFRWAQTHGDMPRQNWLTPGGRSVEPHLQREDASVNVKGCLQQRNCLGLKDCLQGKFPRSDPGFESQRAHQVR